MGFREQKLYISLRIQIFSQKSVNLEKKTNQQICPSITPAILKKFSSSLQPQPTSVQICPKAWLQ